MDAIAPNSNEPTSTGAFQPTQNTKEMEIDPTDSAKVVRVGS